MDFKRVSYLVGCFAFGLIGFVIEVKGENVLHKCKEYSAIYNFGDSNSDTGTFSEAFTLVYPPNGANLPENLPRRNCDGRLIIDFIAEELKVPYLSAYLDSIGSNYSHGANFAAGGASIRQTNFSAMVFGLQISQFIHFKSRTMALYNQSSHSRADRPCFKSRLPKSMDFSNALYTIDIGQNDLSYGFMTSDPQSVRSTIPVILSQFSQGLQQLYNEGARFFWIHNTGPIGCLPRTSVRNKPNPEGLDSTVCRKTENEIAQEFNKQLKDIVLELRKKLPNAKFTHVDVYSAKYELIKDAKNQGFVNPKKFCCGTTNAIHVDCGKKKIVSGKEEYYKCKHPSKYISWDGVHYSEAANRWLSILILNGSFSDPSVAIAMVGN